MKTIPLSQGRVVVVDDEDFDWLSAWSWTFDGRYAVRYTSRDGKRIKVYMHREIVVTDLTVDHANGDELDNRRANLRPATHSQQLANTGIRRNKRTSGFRGVSFDARPNALRKRWIASLQVDGQAVWLGRFLTEREAAEAYAGAARDAFGAFARSGEVAA